MSQHSSPLVSSAHPRPRGVAHYLALAERIVLVLIAIVLSVLAFLLLGVPAAGLLWEFGRTVFVTAFHVPAPLATVAVTVVSLFAAQALLDLPAIAVTSVLDGLQRYDLETLLDFGRSLCFAAGAAVLITRGHGIVALAGLQLALSGLYGAVAVVMAKRLHPPLRLTSRVTRTQVFDLARASLTMLFLRINAIVYGQMDKTILAAVLSTSVLAHYDVAARFHSVVLMALGLVSPVVLSPAAALNATDDRDALKRLFLLGTRVSALCSVPLTIGLMVLAGPILRAWVGPQFAHDAPIVWLFIGYTLFWVVKDVGWNMMIGMGQAPTILRIQVWTTALNLAVSILATIRLGLAGVLIGTLVGNAVATFYYLRLYLPVLRLTPRDFVRQVVAPVYPQATVAGVLLVVACLVRAPGSLVEVALYAVLFAGVYAVLIATTGLSREDMDLITTVYRRVFARATA